MSSSHSHSLFNFYRIFAANDDEDRPPNCRPSSNRSSNCSTSRSAGRSDGFDKFSPVDDDSSWSRESSPAFEIIMDPDLSYRKEAAWQSQEASSAPSVESSPNDNAASPSSFIPPSSDVASYEDSNMDDELWNELMGASDTEMTEPQTGSAASAPESGNAGLDDDEEDEMLAKLTESLDRELEEMKGAQQSAAEKEAAESARSKALLEEQLRVAAEKAALATQFDYLHESPKEKPKKKSKAAAVPRVIRRPSLSPRLRGVDKGLEFERWRRSAARRALKRALREEQPAEPIPGTIVETPASNLNEHTPSAAGTSMQSTQELPRLYHQADRIDWRPLWDRMTLTTNLDTQTCLQCLGLDPVRGQEISDKLKEYLRVPGNSISISRRDLYSNRAKQIISNLAHNLLCDQRWGQTYFNQPHVECGYSNVRFETDSTWILIEFSKLLYQIVKLEERRKKSRLRTQQKKDAKNAVKHPVASNFVTAPIDHGNAPPRDLRQEMVPEPPSAQQQIASTFVTVPVGNAPNSGPQQAAVVQTVPGPASHAPPRGLHREVDPQLASFPSQVSVQHRIGSTAAFAPGPHGNAPPCGLRRTAVPMPVAPPEFYAPPQGWHKAAVPQSAVPHAAVPQAAAPRQVSIPRQASALLQVPTQQQAASTAIPAPAVYAPPRSLQQATMDRPAASQHTAASTVPSASAGYISPRELRRAATTQQNSAPGRKPVVDYKTFMAMYGRKR